MTALSLSLVILATASTPTPPPAMRHIVLLLIDELGVGDMPWADPLLHAPTLRALGTGGLRLGHQYAWHWCAPTRGALLSGRLPMHSGYGEGFGRPAAGVLGMPGDGAGLDLRLPLLPEELRAAGFASAMLGKWHLGFRTPANLPTSRGFDSYLGLLTGGSDHYRKTLCVPESTDHSIHSLCPCADPNSTRSTPGQVPGVDFPWRVDYHDGAGPATALWDNHTYDAYQYGARAETLIRNHDPTKRLFLYWAPHKAHSPLQAAPEFLAPYPDDEGKCASTPAECGAARGWGSSGCGCAGQCWCNRRLFRGMITSVDAMLFNLTVALKAKDMYDDTLFFVLGDNGGPTSAGAYNDEHKGMKFSHWEGGHRVPSFIAGVALGLRGQWYNQTVSLVDLHATILDIAALTARVGPAGVAPADGVSLLPVLNLSVPLGTAIRSELWIADDVLRVGDFKLITGLGAHSVHGMLGRRGHPVGLPLDPTNLTNLEGGSTCTGHETDPADVLICSLCKCESYSGVYDPAAQCTPCIFNVRSDPSESINLAATDEGKYVAMLVAMTARLVELNKTAVIVRYPPTDFTAACDAMQAAGGFFAPWAGNDPPPPPPSTCPARFTAIAGGVVDENDVLAKSATIASAGACCAFCDAHPTCVAWTYLPQYGADAVCWATARPVHTTRQCRGRTTCVSGISVPVPPVPPAVPLPVVPTPKPPLGYQPNIVLFLTDDQDEVLGSRNAMPQAKTLLTDLGATATNWYIFTPVCCPSRAQYLTGRMFHRLRINGVNGRTPGEGPPHVVVGAGNGGCRVTNGNGCMCVNDTLVNTDSFPMYLAAAGYTVGMFGKHLNICPDKMPSGFDRWFANDGGDYIGPNCKFWDNEAVNGTITCDQVQNESGYGAGYETAVIGNKTVEWLQKVGTATTRKPFMAYIGVKAPHLPATPAPWYADYFNDTALDAHYKTPNFDVHGAEHHWLVAEQPPLTTTQKVWIDTHFRDRWRTLLSHDDLIGDVVRLVGTLGLLDQTFFFSTSDHGYNLGQLRLSGCKLHPYENDLKIPMTIRGPGIAPGSLFSHVGQNIDLAPTFLDLAGIAGAGDMDGQSLLAQLLKPLTAAPTRLYTYHEYNSLGNFSVNGGLDDDPISHTWRAVRFPHTDTFGHAVMYAEFTQLDNWNFDFEAHPQAYHFYELFDTTNDPWQTKNLWRSPNVTQKIKTALHELLVANFACRRRDCFQPIKFELAFNVQEETESLR